MASRVKHSAGAALRRRASTRRRLMACATASLGMYAGTASAVQYTYTPVTSGGDDWSTSVNWNATPVGAADAQLTFVGANATILDDALANVNSNNIGAFQLNILDLQGTGPNTGAGTIAINGSAMNFDGASRTINLNALAGTAGLAYTVNAPLTLANTTTFTGAGTASFTFAGAISGAGGVTKSGASTAIFTGANDYAGTTTVSGGILDIRDGSALGTTAGGTAVTTSGALLLRNGITVAGEPISLTGDGSGGNGVLRSNGANFWNGNITVQPAATTRVASDANLFTINGNITLSPTASDQFVLQGSGTGTINGIISGAGRLTRSTTGSTTWTLNGANTYTGQTSISNGALSVQSINSVAVGLRQASSNLGAPTTVAEGAINLGGSTSTGNLIYAGAGATGETTDRVINLNGSTGSGTITNNGTGPLVFTSNFTVTTAASGNKTLTLQGTNTGANEVQGTIPNTTLPATGTISLTKANAGTWILSGANSYVGATNVSAGVLNIRNDSALGTNAAGTTVASGATLQIQGGITVTGENLALTGEGVGNVGALRNISGNNTWTGNVTAGTVTGGVNTRIASDAGLLTISGNVTLSTTPATDQFVLQGDGNGEISGIISGALGRVTRSSAGTGTWTLSGANTYTGQTVVSNGVLSVGSLNSVATPPQQPSSNLGVPSNAANGIINIGSSTAVGTLMYTGPGETTDRVINLAGTTFGGTIDASGSGPLAFTSNFTAGGAGVKTLTLRGSSAAANTVGGAIVNSGGGATSLAKTGTGTWVLGGSNTYTGTTTVSGGTLVITGQHGTSGSRINNDYAVTGAIASPATLAGTGAVFLNAARSITASGVSAADSGAIAPGDPFTAGGIGQLTVDGGNGVVFGANSTFAAQTGAPGTSDLLNVVGGGISMSTASDVLSLTSTATGTFTIASYGGTRTGVFDAVSMNGVPEPGTVNTVGPLTTFTATSGDLVVLYDDTARNIQVTINTVVPEPGTAGLAAIAGAALLARRRRPGI